MTRTLSVVAIMIIGTSGCAGRAEVRPLRADVQQIAQTVNQLAAEPRIATTPSVDTVARTTELGEQVTSLQARLSATSTELARLESRLTGAERGVQEFSTRLDGLGAVVAKLDAGATPLPPVASPVPPRLTPPAVAPPAATPPPPAGRVSVAKPVVGPEEMHAAALRMLRAREHGQAVLGFLDLLGRYPKHALAPSAQYWIGEAYYVQRDYRQALVEFEKVLTYGQSNARAAEALLRLGMASKQLREHIAADEYWRRLVAEHPTSDAAQKARTFMSGIGGTPAPR